MVVLCCFLYVFENFWKVMMGCWLCWWFGVLLGYLGLIVWSGDLWYMLDNWWRGWVFFCVVENVNYFVLFWGVKLLVSGVLDGVYFELS